MQKSTSQQRKSSLNYYLWTKNKMSDLYLSLVQVNHRVGLLIDIPQLGQSIGQPLTGQLIGWLGETIQN